MDPVTVAVAVGSALGAKNMFFGKSDKKKLSDAQSEKDKAAHRFNEMKRNLKKR